MKLSLKSSPFGWLSSNLKRLTISIDHTEMISGSSSFYLTFNNDLDSTQSGVVTGWSAYNCFLKGFQPVFKSLTMIHYQSYLSLEEKRILFLSECKVFHFWKCELFNDVSLQPLIHLMLVIIYEFRIEFMGSVICGHTEAHRGLLLMDSGTFEIIK